VIPQWVSRANEGFRLAPPDVRMVSSDDFLTMLNDRYALLVAAGKGWCDPSVLTMMKDERSQTDHMIVVAETGAPVSSGAQIPATLKGILTLGRDELHGDPEGTVTLHAACASDPKYLMTLLQVLTGNGRLATFGIKHVTATIFPGELLVYIRNGFRVVPGTGSVITVEYAVPSGGARRRKSNSVRSKRKRNTRRNRSKQ